MLLQINTDGELVKKVARSGRGPGEFHDILFLNKSESGEIVVYDQKNQKVVRFDQQLEFVNEFTPKPYRSASIIGIYQISESQYIVQVSPNDYLFDENKDPTLYQLNQEGLL